LIHWVNFIYAKRCICSFIVEQMNIQFSQSHLLKWLYPF
jgi:hypothetical protein